MIKFIGEYCVKVDDKGRIIIPAPFKSLFGKDEKAVFVVKKDIYANCLQMLTYQEWEKESEEVKQRLNFFNREHAQFWREYMRGRAIVEPHLHSQEYFIRHRRYKRGDICREQP